MSEILKRLPWIVAGVALYHMGRLMLHQMDEQASLRVSRARLESEERARRLFTLTRACQRGMLNN
jgi:hypothetical protein